MKAVRNAPPSVEVVDVDEPEGEGELVWVVATEICAPDLKYLRWGSTQIAGHEFAGVLPHTAGRLAWLDRAKPDFRVKLVFLVRCGLLWGETCCTGEVFESCVVGAGGLAKWG